MGTAAKIRNSDNISGKFAVNVSWRTLAWGSYLSGPYLLNPGETHTFEAMYYDSTCDKSEGIYFTIEVIAPTKEIIKNQTMTKTRNVTKYKNVTKTREITKNYIVKKQREIIKNATLFGQWIGKKARYEDIGCRVND